MDMLPAEAVQEFKQIYQNEIGKELSDQEALELAISFFNFTKAVYKPIPQEGDGYENKAQIKHTA